jgi:heme exporter protein D
LFALILYWIADGLPESRIGLTVVTMTSLAIAITAIFLLILTIIVRHKALQRGEHREIQGESRLEGYSSEEDSDVAEEDENTAIFLKRNTGKIVK